jgi:IS30 family transposase
MATVARRLSVQMAQLPVLVRRTLTWDRGMELAGHKEVTAATGLAVYFADPRSPWQRGTNENTNRLLRQYLSKGVSKLSPITHQGGRHLRGGPLNEVPRVDLGDYLGTYSRRNVATILHRGGELNPQRPVHLERR